jgi:hypothetical protein
MFPRRIEMTSKVQFNSAQFHDLALGAAGVSEGVGDLGANPMEIACPSADELYGAELLNWRIQKLILEPTH